MPDTLTILGNIITQFGYPIAVSLIAFWYIYKNNEQHREDIKQMHQEYGDEVKSCTQAISNNTLVMQKLVDKIGGGNFEIKS